MGRFLDDRYELLDQLGSGGMGDVWRAQDHRLDRIVAIKLMRHGPLADETSRARMRSEALLAASIHHPGVASVYDFDEAGASGDGDLFIVMQHVEGHSLAELLHERGPMPPEQVMSILVQVASGLQAAHEAGIVHRDIKPANIMLTPAGRAVLVDFGLARTESSEPLTDTGTVLGTAQYSSPEQSAGRSATPQSDLYSLGVVAHHCLTGTSPFRRDTPIATALAHLNDDTPPLPDDVPGPVRDLVGSLTAKEPSARPSSATDVVAAATTIGADDTIDLPATLGLSTVAPAPTAAGSSTAVSPATATSPTPAASPAAVSEQRRRRVNPRTLVLAATAVLALLVAGFAFLPGDRTAVPDVVGMSLDDATATLRDAGLTATPEPVDVIGATADDVVAQDPPAEAAAPQDGAITLQVVTGEVVVSAGDLLGLTYTEAASVLEDLGLTVARTDVERATDTGLVVALDQSGRLPARSTVTLTIAVAPAVQPDTTGSTDTSPAPAPSDNEKTKGNEKTNGNQKDAKEPKPEKTEKAEKAEKAEKK